MIANTSPGWSQAEVEDLRRHGYDEEQIEEIVDVDRIEPFAVWQENIPAIEIALDCYWERQTGFGGRSWQGVRAEEVECVVRVHSIQRAERLPIFRKARRFINAACRALNKIEAERAEENRS